MDHSYLVPPYFSAQDASRTSRGLQGYGDIDQDRFSVTVGRYPELSDGSNPFNHVDYGDNGQTVSVPSAAGPLTTSSMKRRTESNRVETSRTRDKKPRKRRGRFEPSDRIETSITRGWGACLRCHNQRIRCIPNPHDPNNPDLPCQTCLIVDLSTKKAIHQLPCLRYRLQKIVVSRFGGLGITSRFRHTEVVDIQDRSDGTLQTLQIQQGICETPISVTVRRFNASHADFLARVHVEGRSIRQYCLAPLCLNDVEETAINFKQYLYDHALSGLTYAVRDSDVFIQNTYNTILIHYHSLPDEVPRAGSGDLVPNEEKKVLWDAIVLWFALRHMLGSSWVCNQETVGGLRPIHMPIKQLDGRVPTPRMIIAQFESIQHERILKNLAPAVLKSLQKLYFSNNLRAWFTIYSITFMLLHHASLASADRRRWAQERNLGGTRYGPIDSPLTKYIEELQEGASHLLAHWHYFKHSIELLGFDWDNQQEDSSMKFLTAEQTSWMQKSCDILRNRVDFLQTLAHEESRWENEVYFVSKMFDRTFTTEETFNTTRRYSRSTV